MSAIGCDEEIEQHTTDEPVSVLVTATPAALVVMTVRQGTVVLLVPDTRITPVIVKLLPVESVVLTSVVAGAGAEAIENWSDGFVRPNESLF